MPDPLATLSTRRTPQSEQADPRQTRSVSGGYTFEADSMTRFRRFLATGSEGGTFYASEREHTIENFENVLGLVRANGPEVLDVLVETSTGGHTVKQHPMMLTLAVLVSHADPATKVKAFEALPVVCRTATQLFLFATYVEQFRGWGRGLRKAVASWYTAQSAEDLAYQVAKYAERGGVSHRDLLRLAHPTTTEPVRQAVFAHITRKGYDVPLPPALTDSLRLNAAKSLPEVLAILGESRAVSWEMVPAQWLGNPEVWKVLLAANRVPIGALIRNLGRLTANGTLDRFGQDDLTSRVIGRLTDPAVLAKGRVHPMSVLMAAATYAAGGGLRSDLTWHPIPQINKALNAAFPAAFGSIEPIEDKRAVLALDTSGSMDTNSVAGLPLSCRVAGAALAQSLAAQFPRNMGLAFSGTIDRGTPGRGYRNDPSSVVPFDVDPTRRLTDVCAESARFPFGPTDCALPMLYALERNLRVDAFVVITDNETWAGDIHPHQALRQYREKTGIPARMVTVAMQANDRTIADPTDPLMLDVVGLDSSSISLVGDFIAGRA